MAQKDRKDAATTDTHLPKSVGDFEVLWTCMSKIWNQLGMATYTKEIEINNKRYNYFELTNVFTMFILVS